MVTDPNPDHSTAPNFGQCDPALPDCSAFVIPTTIASLNFEGSGAVPQPRTLLLPGVGFAGLARRAWRRVPAT